MNEYQQQLSWAMLKTGWIVSAALLVLFLTVFFWGNITGVFSPEIRLQANVGNVQGLRQGAPVWLHGIEVGAVESLTLTPKGILIGFSVHRGALHLVSRDSYIQVLTMGLLGDKFIEIKPGNPSSGPVSSGDTLRGINPLQLEDIARSSESSFNQFNHLISMLDTIASEFHQGGGTVNELIQNPKLYDDLTNAAKSLASATHDFQTARGTLHRIIDDPSLYNNLNKSIRELSVLLNKINNGQGIAGSLVNDSGLLLDIRKTLTSADSLISDIKAHPKRYLKFGLF